VSGTYPAYFKFSGLRLIHRREGAFDLARHYDDGLWQSCDRWKRVSYRARQIVVG